jgi:hypothetical protein
LWPVGPKLVFDQMAAPVQKIMDGCLYEGAKTAYGVMNHQIYALTSGSAAKQSSMPTRYEAGWVSQLVWTLSRKIPLRCKEWSPDSSAAPSVASSLYQVNSSPISASCFGQPHQVLLLWVKYHESIIIELMLQCESCAVDRYLLI